MDENSLILKHTENVLVVDESRNGSILECDVAKASYTWYNLPSVSIKPYAKQSSPVLCKWSK